MVTENGQSDGNTSFLRAARNGQLDKVLEYLKSNIDINTSNTNGLNALHLASKDGHVDIVEELLKRGAVVDAATKKGNTALHIASLAGQEEVVKLLVQNGASVNVQSQNGFTPLYMAAQENHDNVVKFLLSNGANQSLSTEDGFTPLAVAMQQGHDKVVAVLLENDTRGKVRLPALHIAAKKDDVKAAKLLLENDHNADVTSKSGFTPLHIASHYGNQQIANLLIQKSADVNYAAKHNITPLHVAAKWGKTNMVSLLLENGATIEAKTRDGLTPLHCAARSGHEQVVDMLLERGAPISSKTKNGLAPLHMAAQGDHVDAARILLYHRAPVDEVTVDYLTALHVAAHCGHVRVAKLLLDRQADANARALNGFTPLHIACKKNRIKVVELLLKHGANISATTESGLTPLHVASFMGCMNIVIYLLQHDANPDVPTVRGETPLHLAARANQTDIIRILLRNGAQVDVRAREQQTPLHIASRLGNADIVALLLQHGAKVDNTTKDMYTSLHIAAKEGQDEVASLLWDNGASLHAVTKKGFTPLHLAAKYGHLKVVKFLLKKEAPVDAQGKNGVTPLHVALHYDHQDVASVLLDKGASPHSVAKNGHTPLHIAARKNQMDIANTLLEYGANPNAESKAGFTPLHLSAQEGHNDMAALLLEHKANVNQEAKNGLTPLHLCAQEDRVPVAEVLVKNGVDVNAATKTGYSPLHIACHYGQINMVRFLLQNGARIESTTSLNYTPLHQAAQQGHANIVNILLDNRADPDATTTTGQTPIMIAQKLGYITVIENLKLVSNKESSPKLNSITTDEKYRVQAPELMHETFMSDSEEEGGEDIILGDHQTYRYLTADEMKSLGDDSLPIDVTRDERIDSNRMISSMDNNSFPPQHIEDSISPEHITQNYVEYITKCVPDNTEIDRYPVNIGKLHWKNFLVSFLVDARGGAMRGCRHSGVRVIVPPRCAPSPTRITCRYVRPQRTPHPPPLMEGEALASRVLELGPVGAKFLGPVIIEVPHFAALRDKEREIVILRSDNGENWKEHTVEATEDMLNEVLQKNFEADDLNELEDISSGRITRIVTQDFPQYFAVVSRIRQEVHAIGPEGGMVSSTVVPQVQAVFPEGALTKKIKVGLQAQPIDPELTAKLLGHGVAVSPVVTVEPRRRKFHKAITLTMPAPKAHSQGMINQYSGSAPTLRLLCSITGGTTRAQWEDVTGSTPLTFVNDCVSFTTTVSARFWLMDCRNISDATKMATELYKEAIHVPFMAKFVVFAKRVDPLEARLRVFCMTDDKEEKTLEHQEHFTEVAKSRDVEVLEGKQHFVEFAGNLVPVTKSGEQLSFCFRAFKENRLPFTVRVKDQHAEAVSRCLFMKEPKVPKGEQPQQPICILNIVLPDDIVTDTVSLTDSDSYKKYTILSDYHRPDPRIADMSNLLGDDWVPLANQLGLTTSEINVIKSEYPESTAKQAQSMLRMWLSQSGSKAQMNTLENALRRIGREDIITHCINVDHSVITRISQEYTEPYREKKDRFEKEIIAKKHVTPKMAKEEEDDEKKSKTRDKYSAEEKEQPEEEEDEEEEEEECFDKAVSERRQKIEKRLSAERAIPASSQRREIVQEITSIKQQNLVEDKLAEVQQKVLEHEEKSKTVLTKTVTTPKQDNKTSSKEEKKSPTPTKETMKALAEEAHKTVEEKFMKGVTQRLEQKTTISLSTTYEAQKSPKLSKTPPPSPADFLFREQAHASQEWESQKDELQVDKLDGTVDKKETCNVHLTEALLTTQPMPLPKPRSKMLDTDFPSNETEVVPTKPKSPVRDDLLDEDEVPESYLDKKKFWENVTQEHSHKRYSLQDTGLSEKESFKKKQLSMQDFTSSPVPKPRTLHSSQSLVESTSSITQERSEGTSSKTSDEDISIQERRQKQNILSFDLKLQKKSQDKKKKVSTDELAQKGSGQNSENLGYISDSEDVEHYISDSEIEDRVPQIRDRMMSVFVPSASSTACRSIYERSASLPTEDLYEVSARTIKARKEYYEEQIRKEMIEEQLTSELEEEPSPERKNLLLSSTEEDHTEADAKSIGEDVEDIREEHAYDTKKKTETKSIDHKVITEERISTSSSKVTEHIPQSEYIEEMSFIQKSKLNEPRNGISKITHDDFQFKVDKDNEHKLFETQHSISSDKSGDHIDEQNFRDDSHSTKPDSMEVLVDKSELEDSEKLADLDQDIEGKSIESLDIDESPKQTFVDTELKNGHFDREDRREKFTDECQRDVNIKLPQENIQNVVWEVSVESASKNAFSEQADDLHVQEVVRVTEKFSEVKSVSKIPILKKNEPSKSVVKDDVVIEKKDIEKQSKIPKPETEIKLPKTGDVKLLDETAKFIELESRYNPDSPTELQKSSKEQSKTSKYSDVEFESSHILPARKKDLVTKVDETAKFDKSKIKDDIQTFIESETKHTTDYTRISELQKLEPNKNKDTQNTVTDRLKKDTELDTDIDKCSKSKADVEVKQEKLTETAKNKEEIVSDFDKVKVKKSTRDFLENETKHITDYTSQYQKLDRTANIQQQTEVSTLSKVASAKEPNRTEERGYNFDQAKLKTDTEQFLGTESKHVTDYTKVIQSSDYVVTKTDQTLKDTGAERKSEDDKKEKISDRIDPIKFKTETENFLEFESRHNTDRVKENSQFVKEYDSQLLIKKDVVNLEKENEEMSEKNIKKSVISGETKPESSSKALETATMTEKYADKILKEKTNAKTVETKIDTQKFIELESQYNTDFNSHTIKKDSSISKPVHSLATGMVEKELGKSQGTKIDKKETKDQEKTDEIRLTESNRIKIAEDVASFIESESNYNTDYEQITKPRKDPKNTVKIVIDDVKSETSKKLDKLAAESKKTESETEKKSKLKTDTQGQSEIEKLIFDCLQQQKVHPDEALKIANALVEEIEAEIQKHDSLGTEPIEKLEEKTNIPEFLRHLAETKGLDQREVELVESVLARKRRGFDKLSRGDTQASSVEITDEDLKYSGTDLEYSQVLEQQIDQLEAEKVSNLDSESFEEPSDNSQSKTTFIEKTGEEHSEDTEWSHDFGSNEDTNILAMKKGGFMKTHENIVSEKVKIVDDKVCSDDDKSVSEKISEESEISKTKIETVIAEDSHILLKDLEIKASQTGTAEVQADHISNVTYDKIKIIDKDKPEEITLEQTQVASDDKVSAIYNAESHQTEMSKDKIKQINKKTEEKYDELNKEQEKVLKKESISIKVADDGSQIKTKEDIDKTFSVKSSTTITQTHQREETSSTTLTEDTEAKEIFGDELLKELESGEVKTIVETHEVVRRTSSNELKDVGYSKKDDSDSPSVVLRKSKSDTSSSSPKMKPDRKSGYDYEINSSSGESHYQSFEMDSNKSRPCSSDVEGLIAAGSSEYESALTSQIYSAKSQISTDYKTVSSMSSKDSMKSLDSESSGNLASVEVSEHSETLVPSTSDLDDILDSVDHQLLADESELNEQNLVWSNRSMDTHHLNEVSDSEGLSFAGVDESMEASEEESPELKTTEVQSKMKRSCEMTFQPEPKILAPESPHADSEDKIGTSLDDGSIFSTSMSSTSSTGAQRTVIEQSRADSDRLEGSMNVSSEHLSLEDVDSIPRGSIDSVIIPSNLTSNGSPTALPAGITEAFTDEMLVLDDGNQMILGKQSTEESTTSVTSATAPEQKKKGHKRTESTVLVGTLTRFSTEQYESEKKSGSQLSSKEISFEDKQDIDEREKCDTRTSSQVSSLDKESDTGAELLNGSKAQPQTSISDSGHPIFVSDDKLKNELTNADKSTDLSEESSIPTSSPDPLAKFKFDDFPTPKTVKEFEHKDRDHFDRKGEIHHEKKNVEEGEAEAVFSMVPPISPAHKIKEIQPILEDDVAEKHELESQERIKKDTVVVTTAILKDASPVPDIKITQHMAPLVDNNFHYPELELESKERQQEQQQETLTDTPQTPASNSSKSSEETDQGREYVLNESVSTIQEEPEGTVDEPKKGTKQKQTFKEKKGTDSPDSSDSFEMLEKPDLIDDFVVIEEVGKEAHELDTEGKSVKIAKVPKPAKKHDEEVEQYLAHSAPTPLTRMTDIKYYPDGSSTEGAPFDFEESPPQVAQEKTKKESDSQYDKELEANKKWVEQQFQGDHATMIAAGYGYEMDFERGPLEDIKEEDITDFAASSYGSQKDSGGSVKESYSSTPEYDVLAGRKYFTRSGEHDDTSMSSLQEFENLEQAMSLEMRRLHQGSQDSSSNGSFKTRYIVSKSGQGDDISVSSLKEFEGLEKACIAAHKIEIKVKEEEALLAQIEEGQESIASESESCETISGTEKKAVTDTDEEDYEKRMFEIDEIIKQAQSNVERFVDLKDVEKTESLGRGDSVEEVSKVPDLDLDTPVVKSTIKVQWKENEDVMMTSTDSLEQQIGQTSRHDSADSLDQETAGNIMTTSTDSLEAHLKKSSKDNVVSDSMEGHGTDKNYIVSSDSLDLAAAVQHTDTNVLMTDSMDEDSSKFGPYDHSTSSTGKDLNSSTKDDFSQDKDDEHQADNLDISSSAATHATYQYETDSVFSGSFTSGGSNTMVSSTNSLDQARQGTSVDLAGAVRQVWFDEDDTGDKTITEFADESSKPYVTEIIEPSSDDYYSHVIHRKVELPPEVRKITFTGADADEQMKKFLEEFKEGEECEETEEIDSDGNIHIRKVLTRRIVVKDDGGQQAGPEIEEYFRQLNQPEVMKGKGIIGSNISEDKEGKQEFAAASSSKSITKHSRDMPEMSTSSEQPTTSSVKASRRRPLRCEISIEDQTEVDPREHDWRFNLPKHAEGEEGSDKEEIDKKTDQQ